MSEKMTITGDDVQALADKLEDYEDLTAHERSVLAGIFALAGQSVALGSDDVEGFMPTAVENVSLNFTHGVLVPAVQRQGLVGSFSWGMKNPPSTHGFGSDGGAG